MFRLHLLRPTPAMAVAIAAMAVALGGTALANRTGAGPAPSGEAGVPSNAVMFFRRHTCPSGWAPFTLGRGRYIVGVPAGGKLLGTEGVALTNLEDRPTGQQSISIHDPGPGQSLTGPGATAQAIPHMVGQAGNSGNEYGIGSSYGTPLGPVLSAGDADLQGRTAPAPVDLSGTVGSVAGTNAPYLQLLACIKS